ncbi:MAG: hypothetical protein VYD40_04105 [Chloroflexota bacterium]|jgi:hypothetical protein|nr:hypothetical protein [Chloroflexota bacterium]MEC7270877.1 hypothetical protein [Chloroflexota bacterium]MEC8713174.1 hypothetical protein [Chloroflexota bacterium]MEE2620956.1 hypothetical protein [Chloroflexota bacterium]GIR91501.1 MAG: hypothetical protein CM15mP91_2710 [Chloroflexota bacterium]|tara:strand:- start:163 stop:456 length:294 start_codon:yes stop_codon:yes gene_type:complete
MDPGMLSVEDWQARLLALRLMWLCLILAFTAAGSLVIAHAVIPSAVDSGTLSKKFNKFRLPLYLTGIFAFVLDVAVFLYALSLAQGIISDIYPSFWQ